MPKDKAKNKNTYIYVFDNYYIATDRMSHEARKGNEKSYKVIGYFGSLDKALIAIKKDYTRKVIMSHEVLTLDDAISIIVRTNNHFEALIKNAFEGIET